MPIPSSMSEVKKALLDELRKAGGVGKTWDITVKLFERFKLIKVPHGKVLHDQIRHKKIHDAIGQLRKEGLIKPIKKRGILELTQELGQKQGEGALPEIKSAKEATEKALNYVKDYYPFYHKPIKVVKEDGTWLLEIDVGLLTTTIAKVKVDAKTGNILEFIKSA